MTITKETFKIDNEGRWGFQHALEWFISVIDYWLAQLMLCKVLFGSLLMKVRINKTDLVGFRHQKLWSAKKYFPWILIFPSSNLDWVINLVVISQWKSNVNVKTTLKERLQNPLHTWTISINRHNFYPTCPDALPEWLFELRMKMYCPITHSENDEHLSACKDTAVRVRQKTMSVNKKIMELWAQSRRRGPFGGSHL